MKTSNEIKHYKTKSDYHSKTPSAKSLKKPEGSKTPLEAKKDQVDVTPKKDVGESPAKPASAEAATGLAKSVSDKLTKLPFKKLPMPPKLGTAQLSKIEKKQFPEVKNAPGVFFLGGAKFLGLMSGDDGVRAMAQGVKGAEYYEWSDQDKVIAEIKKRPLDQPIVLVGHSFGGDTAVQIAKELNKVEHGFREISLLVTMDSIGMDNDIIPMNVKKNMNYISDDYLSDAPNIASDTSFTDVINELVKGGHRDLDNNEEIQMKVLKDVNEIVFLNSLES